MGTNGKIVKSSLLAGLFLLCVLLPDTLFGEENSNSQINPPTVTQAKYNEVADYIKKSGYMGALPYSETRKVITKDKLPILYELLDDDEYALYWRHVVEAIGYISDDSNSVNVLLEFIQRNDNKKLDKNSLWSKICAFEMIGLIGGDTADSVLRKSYTEEGIRELTKDWIDEPLSDPFDTDIMIQRIQEKILLGLVYSGKPENLALVEKIYNEQKEISLKNHRINKLAWASIDAMGMKDYIAEVGIETYMDKRLSGGKFLGDLRPYLKKYNIGLNEADSAYLKEKDSAEAVRKAKESALGEFVKQNLIPYDQTRETFDKDQLTILYKMLEDDTYALNWGNITEAIGYISDGNDTDSVTVLLNYFQRNDSAKNFKIYNKIWSLAWIGKIGGDQTDLILRMALTKEGARELAKSWIDEELWQDAYYMKRKENVFIDIQFAALDGLVFSGKKENLDLVEKFYNEQKDISIKNHYNTDIMYALIDVMAKKDYIADHGLESWLKIGSVSGSIITPYLKKYNIDLNEADSAAK